MSQKASDSEPLRGADPGTGLDGLRRRPGLGAPVDPHDEHEHGNDHVALVYESDEELYRTLVPFIRQGLDGGERCIYVLDQRSEAAVTDELRDRGVDVDDALASGALSFYTVEETYLREEPFDPDAMLSFYADVIEDTLETYAGLRVAAGTGWIDEVSLESFMEYEGRVNALFEETDSMALCHYSRDRLSSEVIHDVIRTHPHLIYDDTVCQNFYYTPPEELFDAEGSAQEVDRLLGTVRDRARAKAGLAEHKRFLQELNEVTSSPDLSFEEKLQGLFELGCEWFDLDLGGLNIVDPEADSFVVEYLSHDHDHFEPGIEMPLSETYCQAAAGIKDAATVSNPAEEGYDDVTVYEEFGAEAYLGTYIPVDGGPDRTFGFLASEPREVPFTEDELTYLELMGQWVKYELDRRCRERYVAECYDVTSDPDLSFERKLEELLDLGREWLGLEMAGLNRLSSWDGPFRLEKGAGLDVEPADEPLLTNPAEGCYCRRTITEDAPVSVVDVRGTDWEEDAIYDRVGLTCYIGTRVTCGSTPYGTLWFGSTDPRDRPFTDAEETFVELTSQWVSYEIERRERERELEDTVERLEQSNNRLEQFAHAASHDLQEPLRMVSSYLQLLEDQHGDDLDDDAREFIDYAVDGAERMRGMVDDLLAYSRVERSEGEVGRTEIDAVLERVTDDLRVQIEESDAVIEAGPLPTVEADEEQLELLFRNLVSNAIKYNDEGRPHVEVTAEEGTDRWEFAVADDGIGIDPEKTDRIFEVFKRLHHDDEYAGTGIGLSLCQEIVDNHGGDIWVESEPGEGATFDFTLPRSGAADERGDAPPLHE